MLNVILLERCRELGERSAPAGLAIAYGPRWNAGMLQGHDRLSVIILERHGHQQFQRPFSLHSVVRSRDHVPFLVRETIGTDNPLHWNDLAVHARTPIVLALGRAHAIEILASQAEIDLAGRRRETLRSPPAHDAPGVGPRFPDGFARRIEDACYDEVLGHRRYSRMIMSCGHICPPWQPPGQPLRLAAAHDRLALRWNLRCPEIMGCFMSRVSEGFANIGCAPVSLEGCMHQAEFPGPEAGVMVRVPRPG